VKSWALPVGLEIGTSSGYRLDQISNLIRKINKQIRPVYLHLTMGQLKNPADDASIVGSALSTLVLEFIKTYTD
jgi:TPP-dependent 2-oxoacid decarboxylase